MWCGIQRNHFQIRSEIVVCCSLFILFFWSRDSPPNEHKILAFFNLNFEFGRNGERKSDLIQRKRTTNQTDTQNSVLLLDDDSNFAWNGVFTELSLLNLISALQIDTTFWWQNLAHKSLDDDERRFGLHNLCPGGN